MKNLRLHKVVTLVAALALASTAIAGDALARGGGHVGGGFGGHGIGHMGGGFAGGPANGAFHGGHFAHDDFHHGRRFFAGGPFYDDYYYDYGTDCWRSERVHTPAGLRWRNVWTCSY